MEDWTKTRTCVKTAIIVYGDNPDDLKAKIFRFKCRRLGAAELLEVGAFMESLKKLNPKYVRMFFVGEGLGAELDISLAESKGRNKNANCGKG